MLWWIHLSVLASESLGFSMYNVMSSANKDSFTSSFPVQMPSLSSCLIAVAGTPSTLLNKRGASGHPCLVPDLKGNPCSFACWIWCCQWVCHICYYCMLYYMAFTMFRYVPPICTLLRVLIINECWILSKAFFCIYCIFFLVWGAPYFSFNFKW